MRRFAVLYCLLSAGCVVVELGVTNPIPGLSTVAVAPFMNLSQERAVDGRRFAIAYFSELQKVPGFQVIPVGVTEQAIVENKIQMNDPDDVLELARILDVDAVVIGAITDYDPYYPPRIGLQVAWYSPESWVFSPGVQTDPYARKQLREIDKQRLKQRLHSPPGDRCDGNASSTGFWGRIWPKVAWTPGIRKSIGPELVRAQSDVLPRVSVNRRSDWPSRVWRTSNSSSEQIEQALDQSRPAQTPQIAHIAQKTKPAPPATAGRAGRDLPPTVELSAAPIDLPAPAKPEIPSPPRPVPAGNPRAPSTGTVGLAPIWRGSAAGAPPSRSGTLDPIGPQALSPAQLDPRKPLMSYTRIFDGLDANLVAALRDYLELSGDRRSGGWEGYLHRSEDFIRFTAHIMIVEMLTLHGGEGKRRIVFKRRKRK